VKKIKIFDRNFGPSGYTTPFQESKYFVWDRSLTTRYGELSIYTDFYLRRSFGNFFEMVIRKNIKSLQSPFLKSLLSKIYRKLYGDIWLDVDGNKNKIGMLLEPIAIMPTTYQFIKKYADKYDKILTYDRQLLGSGENFLFYPFGGCWIKPEDQRIYEKHKLLSTIASRKKITEGHKMRHEIIQTHKKSIDVYGGAYHPISNKIFALKDYMFSLTIENCQLDYYFTEKLIDCFMTGTIPIYWGCPSISDFFDIRGMIMLKNSKEFSNILCILTKSLYDSKLEFIESNFETAKKYLIAEDWIYENLEIFSNTGVLLID
jgi:Glycosyltransferase family 10 (fucosyltransferase) C-term